MLNNPFETAGRRFNNLESAEVHIVRLHCEPVRQFLESVKSVYRTIDFCDEYQAQLARLLWRFRCSVLFGLAPYDHEELRLVAQGEEIFDIAERLPGSRESVAMLKQRLSALLEQKENPKLEWVLKQAWSENEPAAIFALMAMRKSFGSDLVARYSANQNKGLGIITSLKLLEDKKNSTLVLPGTLQYLSYGLFMKLFHQGEFRRIHVILYEGESLSLKSRMQLPDSSLFPRLSEGVGLNIQKTDDSDSYKDHINDEDLPTAAQIFGTSEGMFKGRSGGCLSRFLLCDDGSEFYISESERVRVWRPDAPEKLAYVFPVQLMEGDFVILEKGQREDFLDQADSNTRFLAELDATGVWRKPLRAMLLSSSSEEIANRMMATCHLDERGAGLTPDNAVELSGEVSIGKPEFSPGNAARNLKTNISKWAEGQVYGPRDLYHLLALVQVLMDNGYLQIESSPECAARQWFKDLEKLRASRRTAGMSLSDQIDHLLEDSVKAQAMTNDGMELLLDNGMLVSVHQLAMISDQVGASPESFLRKPV